MPTQAELESARNWEASATFRLPSLNSRTPCLRFRRVGDEVGVFEIVCGVV